MKTIQKSFFLFLTLGITLFFVSCEKEQAELVQSPDLSSQIEIGKSMTESEEVVEFIPSKLVKETLSVRDGEKAAETYNIAFIGSSDGDVDQIVANNGLGTVTLISPADVPSGVLISGGYDLFINGRHSYGNNSPAGFDQAIEDALDAGLGMITEWVGGVPMFTEVGVDPRPFVFNGNPDGSLFGLFEGEIDKGYYDPASINSNVNIAPDHPVMAGVPETYSICAAEFPFRLINADSRLEGLSTVEFSNGETHPIILAGAYGESQVVFWLFDWIDGSFCNDEVRRQIIKNAIQFAGTPAVIDSDGDGVLDDEDNCPEVPNEDQADNDGDGAGDACDDDDDNDGVLDGDDNCQFDANADQADYEGDGIGDVCDDDDDNDGCADDSDPHPNSNLDATVIIDGCDSGVSNTYVSDDGCSNMSDLIADAAADANNHGQFVSAVSQLANAWKSAGIITGAEKGAIVSCAAQSNLP